MDKSGYKGLQESMGGNAGRPPQLDDVDLGYLSLEGHSRQAFLSNSKQESIQAFLERIKAANAEYQAIVVNWDNSISPMLRLRRQSLAFIWCTCLA
ncbi:hypothetical protein [Methylobacter sp.]|uniref:hypothetical protein n=1 Tax=Methylobacter sp. TaxID=2051955 RepID=UPI0012250951|nr:hypothetical protein [Methylobacter sp.]TAK61524.1 MAG: hypothetical protein EPO18_13550 [Methylobacter sp.]